MKNLKIFALVAFVSFIGMFIIFNINTEAAANDPWQLHFGWKKDAWNAKPDIVVGASVNVSPSSLTDLWSSLKNDEDEENGCNGCDTKPPETPPEPPKTNGCDTPTPTPPAPQEEVNIDVETGDNEADENSNINIGNNGDVTNNNGR